MAQDPFSTRPIANEPPTDSDAPSAAAGQPARRRLGGWVDAIEPPVADLPDALATAQLAAATPTPPPDRATGPIDGWFDGPATAPMPGGAVTATMSRPTLNLTASSTAPLPSASFESQTASIAVATAPIPAATAPMEERAMAVSAVTVPIAHPTAPIAATNGSDELASADVTITLANGSFAASAPTATMAAPTAPIQNVTAQIDQRAVVTAEGVSLPATTETAEGATAELDRFRARARAHPNDSDALFELSVALHRAGQRAEAREVLTKLVALYEQRGQHQQAARIMVMLGGPKTGPIATDGLPAKNQATQATVPFSTSTAALRSSTSALSRAGEKARAKSERSVPAFSPESLIFTMPLPDEDRLSDEALSHLRQSEMELRTKRFAAAFDSCLQVINVAPDYTPVYLRLAELYTRQRLHRRARAQAEALIRLAHASGRTEHLWMVYRVLLHASGSDQTSLRQLVELLIDAGQRDQASFYASRLIQLLDAEGLSDQALQYSIRLGEIIPGDTRAALENAILRVKGGDPGGALDRWEAAVAAGADPMVARASVAALTAPTNEDDHWRMLAEIAPACAKAGDSAIAEAYARTAAALPESPTLVAGRGVLMAAAHDPGARGFLAQAAGNRAGSPFARAVSAVALAWSYGSERVDEYVAAVRTALKLLSNEGVAAHPAWQGLVGRVPRFEDLSLELGEVLLSRSDAAGAADVLKEAHARTRQHGPICERLAEAYFKIGQLGSALTVLDELAVHYRTTGQLEAMAGVLRHMSQLAPNNIKVKSRLIDAYLQRGFVAEARAELIQRADLEERSGLLKDAVTSLQRAADLSWTIGQADETFSLYNRLIKLAPDDVGNRTALVNFYLQMQRFSEAAEHQRAVADIALRGDNKHEAVAALHQVIGLTPDDTNAYYQLADLLATMGEFHQAEKVYRRLVLMNPSDAIAQAKATAMAALRESKQH